MNTALWIIQILVGVMFIILGGLKLAVPREKLLASGAQSGRQNMAWVEDFTPNRLRLIGLLELLGGTGLILPSWTGIMPVLTPFAAVGLTIVMIGAIVVHVRRNEATLAFGPATLALLALFISFGRFFLFKL